jgi:MYXO-CTERM domain-containing protein
VDADMELHAWDGVRPSATHGWWYTCAPPGSGTCPAPGYGQEGCIYVDIGNTVTHEAGHVLGLDHTCTYAAPYHDVCGSVMDPSASYGDTNKRTLTDDDVSAVCTIYPAGRAVDRVTACPNPPPEAGGCGCSTASPGALAPFGLLVLALGIRRRARQRTIAPA